MLLIRGYKETETRKRKLPRMNIFLGFFISRSHPINGREKNEAKENRPIKKPICDGEPPIFLK
jgi:hypothetical protein